jgi:RNA polymerase sigma-70 factor (ECF subfamily)
MINGLNRIAIGLRAVHPRALLSRLATRLALGRLGAAQARRETYIGPWLPEPPAEDAADVEDRAEEVAA